MPENGWTNISLRDGLAARLDNLRRTLGKGGEIPSRASLVQEAVEEYLDKHKVRK